MKATLIILSATARRCRMTSAMTATARRCRVACGLAAAMLALPAHAQQPWTLEQCISHALSHNIGIKQRENQQRQQALQLSTARSQRLPDLNGSASQNFSFGRGLTAENTYTNTNTSSTSFSLGTSIPLLTGNRLPKQVLLARLNLEAATHDLERARNDISVQVAQQFVQVLYCQEISAVARRQTAVDSAQVARLSALFRVGRANEAEVAQMRSALAQSQLAATQAEGNVRLALLALSQLLELPSAEGFAVAAPTVDDATIASAVATATASPQAVYSEAMALRPEISAERLRLQAADASIAIARSGLYPTLSFSAGMGSNYYKTSGFRAESFGTQLKNNFSQYLGFSLNVPIFNRFQVRNSIRSAKIDRENQQLALDNAGKTLYKEIQTAYSNTVTAQEKLRSSTTARQTSQTAFALVQAKYELGRATVTEFSEARNNLLRAESDLLQARYEYLYQKALMSFYRGQPLSFE